jgi:hypothetical protein
MNNNSFRGRKMCTVLPYPYPYHAMLAICSDLDLTPDFETYYEIMRFLNSSQETASGKGLGLETGNSLYFYMKQNQFAYWNTSKKYRRIIREMIHSGHIDCLHSFGDLALSRDHAKTTYEVLIKNNCRIPVWVDHAIAPTNLGNDIMKGHGDEIGHQAYHADMLRAYGIRYVWRGRVTSIIGQDRPISFSGIYFHRHPFTSLYTLAVEAGKQLLARAGNKKYRLHRYNAVLEPILLRDGSYVYEFMRSNPFWGGVSSGDRGDRIHQVLTPLLFERLFRNGGVCILYTHLGKNDIREGPEVITPQASKAMQMLSRYQEEQKILVTTTSRILDYITTRDRLRTDLSIHEQECVVSLHLQPHKRPVDWQYYNFDGISFKINTGLKTRFVFKNKDITSLLRTQNTANGATVYSFPWKKLHFPLYKI